MSAVLLAVRDLFLPRRCFACTEPLEGGWPRNICDPCIVEIEELSFEGEPVCPGCALRMKKPRTGSRDPRCRPCRRGGRAFDAAASFGRYEGALRSALVRFKEEPAVGEPLGLLAIRAASALPLPDLIVPVPLHPKRLMKRGFNQSAFLAVSIAEALDVPLIVDALRRTVDVPKQSVLKKKQRMRAARATVEARRPIEGTVMLVDDVLTTGATAEACAHALRKAGASRVVVVTVARAE